MITANAMTRCAAENRSRHEREWLEKFCHRWWRVECGVYPVLMKSQE